MNKAVGAIAALTAATMAAVTPFHGLSDREIVAEIHRSCAPDSLIVPTLGIGGRWEIVYRYACQADGTYQDYFAPGASTSKPRGDFSIPPEGLELAEVASAQWWNYRQPSIDLHNLLPTHAGVMQAKGSDIPGELPDAGAGFAIGTISIGGEAVGAWTPPAPLRGDVARILMYCACVWKMEMWPDPAYLLYADGGYPALTDRGADLLMRWHRADPVDRSELRRDSVIASVQGNYNPFVVYPDLAEYVWGSDRGQVYNPDGAQAARHPLRRTYSVADTVWLYSPYIDRSARWTVDGTPVTGDHIVPGALSPATHTLIYTTAHLTGALKIIVQP